MLNKTIILLLIVLAFAVSCSEDNITVSPADIVIIGGTAVGSFSDQIEFTNFRMRDCGTSLFCVEFDWISRSDSILYYPSVTFRVHYGDGTSTDLRYSESSSVGSMDIPSTLGPCDVTSSWVMVSTSERPMMVELLEYSYEYGQYFDPAGCI